MVTPEERAPFIRGDFRLRSKLDRKAVPPAKARPRPGFRAFPLIAANSTLGDAKAGILL
jgi:hypothetical protein